MAMATDRIVVVAESFDGKALPVSLELLTKARQLAGHGRGRHLGATPTPWRAQLGAYGATKVYAVGDLGAGPARRAGRGRHGRSWSPRAAPPTPS